MDIPFLTVMGVLAAGAVLIAVAVALTLVPALLALAGHRIVVAPGAQRRIRRAAEPGYRSLGHRWVIGVQWHPEREENNPIFDEGSRRLFAAFHEALVKSE